MHFLPPGRLRAPCAYTIAPVPNRLRKRNSVALYCSVVQPEGVSPDVAATVSASDSASAARLVANRSSETAAGHNAGAGSGIRRPGGGDGGGGGGGDGGGDGGRGSGGDGNSGRGYGDGGGYLPPSQPWLWPVYLLKKYLLLLDSLPLLTKCATSAVLGALSDLIAQAAERAIGKDDTRGTNWRRVGALALVGAVLTAPVFHFLYEALELALPVGVGGKIGVRNTAVQLFIDQVVVAPVWLVAFFALFGTVEAGRFERDQIEAQLRRDFLKSLRMTWYVFPLVQVFSFSLLPINMRVLVLNVVDLGYTAVLSLVKHT